MLRTVGDLAGHLGLIVLAAPDGLAREVRWAVPADLRSAAAAARAGELVMVRTDPRPRDGDSDRLVADLAAADVAGIVVERGGGRPELVLAAGRHALPLLEAPEHVSFEEISRLIASSVLGAFAAENRRLADGLVALTHAARLGGPVQLVATLASRVDGWAVVVDRDGRPRLATGGANVHLDDAVAAASGHRRRVRHPGLLVQAIGENGPRAPQLVVAARPGQESYARALAAQAAVLLELIDRPVASLDVTRQARIQAVEMLLLGHHAAVRRIADGWGLGAGAVAVARLRSRSRSVYLEPTVLGWLGELALPELIAGDGPTVTALLPAEALEAWSARVRRAADDELVPVRCGIGTAVAVDRLAHSAEQATQALEVAIADGRVVVPYAQLPTSRLLLGGTGNAALVDRALAGLDVAGAQTATLIESLRVFLAEVGSWEAAAAQLGVHRHTLRHRIARVEALTGRDLSRMEDRVELWVALRARGLLD